MLELKQWDGLIMYVIFLSDAKESKDILVVNDSDNDDEKKVSIMDCFVSHCCLCNTH